MFGPNASLSSPSLILIFAQNIHCGNTADAGLTSTHNACFGSKLRKLGVPLQTPAFLYKLGFKGVYISLTCFLDVYNTVNNFSPRHYNVSLIR